MKIEKKRFLNRPPAILVMVHVIFKEMAHEMYLYLGIFFSKFQLKAYLCRKLILLPYKMTWKIV